MKKQEAQRPRGPRYPKGPKHTETPLTRCYHNEDLIPTELSNTTLDLRGPEAQRPRGPEAKWQKKNPGDQNPQRPKIPRGPETQSPKGPEAQEAQESLRPKRPIHHQLMFIRKIIRIRIQILVFGLNYSNNIRIPNYSLTSGPDRRL